MGRLEQGLNAEDLQGKTLLVKPGQQEKEGKLYFSPWSLDSPQAPVAGLSKWLELSIASARYRFGLRRTIGSSVARVTLAAILQLGLRSTFSFADTGSPPKEFPS